MQRLPIVLHFDYKNRMPRIVFARTRLFPTALAVVSMLCAFTALSFAEDPITIHVTIAALDHPSGLYYPKENAALTLVAENARKKPQDLTGQFQFGRLDNDDHFKALAVTPITTTTLKAGERVELNVPVTFAEPGRYELHWNNNALKSVDASPLTCIYAPRGGESELPPLPFLQNLPLPMASRDAAIERDYVKRSGITYYFAIDDPTQTSPASSPLAAANLRAMSQSGAKLILRIQNSSDLLRAANAPELIHKHVAILAATGLLYGLAIDPGDAELRGPDISHFRSIYLAAYDAAKKADRNVHMLGTGRARDTVRYLLEADGPSLAPYVDTIGTLASPADLVIAQKTSEALHTPVWLLPTDGPQMPAVVALEQQIPLAPLPERDFGLTAHLLGGVVHFQTLHPELPPYLAVFQANGYAIAAIAGLGASTPRDAQWPALLDQLRADPGHSPSISLVSSDDMKVITAAGLPVETKHGDTQEIPLRNQLYYLLAPGNAEDLVASLRTADIQSLPPVEISLAQMKPAVGDDPAQATINIRNTTSAEFAATLKITAVPADAGDQKSLPLGSALVPSVKPGKAVAIPVDLPHLVGPMPDSILVEITAEGRKTTAKLSAMPLITTQISP